MLVKICGIKTVEAAKVASESGANLIGFVFAPSKRKIDPQEAKMIAESLPSSINKVGVFVNETVEKMDRIGQEVGLDLIQLHGDEPAEVGIRLANLNYNVIRALSVEQIHTLPEIDHDHYDYILLDSPPREHRGGSGERFDWTIISNLAIARDRLILAGGLTPENIEEAVTFVMPAGVDVSTGVETDGVKDHEKIKAFIERARQASSRLK